MKSKGDIINLVEVMAKFAHTTTDRIFTRRNVLIRKYPNGYEMREDATLGVLVVTTQDFNLDWEPRVLDDCESFQIRPKALFLSDKGVYFKDNGSRRYLTKDQISNLATINPSLGEILYYMIANIEELKPAT